jgi:hypothetical protein
LIIFVVIVLEVLSYIENVKTLVGFDSFMIRRNQAIFRFLINNLLIEEEAAGTPTTLPVICMIHSHNGRY